MLLLVPITVNDGPRTVRRNHHFTACVVSVRRVTALPLLAMAVVPLVATHVGQGDVRNVSSAGDTAHCLVDCATLIVQKRLLLRRVDLDKELLLVDLPR